MRNQDADYVKVVPHERQIVHQQMEFYAFFHFTINTFTGREWGDGTESPSLFNPMKMDASQWVSAIKKAGMRGAILTCKHHDGFCLWPSKYTDHTIAVSPYKGGCGDIVKEVADACKTYGLKFGIYLSPWDRNNKTYGTGRPYDDFYLHQLEELLTGYGEIFSVWLDGACGEGANGKRQEYDWDRYYQCVRRLQPGACISVCGPDVRWCGNEAGDTRISEWSVVPAILAKAERVQNASQQEDNVAFREQKISSTEQELGSREALASAKELIWFPTEVNTSIRPGWFYHEEEDDKVRSLEELLYIYNHSVGGNSTFLLNIPPTPVGLLHPNDVKRLEELGDYFEKAFAHNLMEKAMLQADTCKPDCSVKALRRDNYLAWYQPEEGRQTAEITINLMEPANIGHIVLKENITQSQRIESFEVYVGRDDELTCVFRGTVVGHKKIIPLPKVWGSKIAIRITDSRISPTLSFIGIYE